MHFSPLKKLTCEGLLFLFLNHLETADLREAHNTSTKLQVCTVVREFCYSLFRRTGTVDDFISIPTPTGGNLGRNVSVESVRALKRAVERALHGEIPLSTRNGFAYFAQDYEVFISMKVSCWCLDYWADFRELEQAMLLRLQEVFRTAAPSHVAPICSYIWPRLGDKDPGAWYDWIGLYFSRRTRRPGCSLYDIALDYLAPAIQAFLDEQFVYDRNSARVIFEVTKRENIPDPEVPGPPVPTPTGPYRMPGVPYDWILANNNITLPPIYGNDLDEQGEEQERHDSTATAEGYMRSEQD